MGYFVILTFKFQTNVYILYRYSEAKHSTRNIQRNFKTKKQKIKTNKQTNTKQTTKTNNYTYKSLTSEQRLTFNTKYNYIQTKVHVHFINSMAVTTPLTFKER